MPLEGPLAPLSRAILCEKSNRNGDADTLRHPTIIIRRPSRSRWRAGQLLVAFPVDAVDARLGHTYFRETQTGRVAELALCR